jgi:hypothetical protein
MRGIIVSLFIFISAGCAVVSTAHRMDIEVLRDMKPDCANAAAQIRYLESQLAAPEQANFSGKVVSFVQGRQQQDQITVNQEFNRLVKTMIWTLRSECQN